MHRTDDADRWIANQVDPWTLAAAHAGDIRAMRFAARRVDYRPSHVYERLSSRVGDRPEEFGLADRGDVLLRASEAGRRGRAFWYAKAAEHGDAEAIAALLEEIGPEHQKEHLHHLLAIAKYSAGSAEGFRVPGLIDLFLAAYPIAVTEAGPLRDLQERWDSKLCEAGARDGCEPCMRSWAEQERSHGPGCQASADRGQGRAEQELAENPPPGFRSSDELDELGNRAVSALLWSDAEWVAMVADQIPPYGHRMQHLLRLLAAARFPPDSPGTGADRRLPGWWGIELCRAGAGAAFEREPCIERWADYQRNHGPSYEAELHLWQERAEQELTERLPPPPPPRFGAGPSTAQTIVTTAVITSVLVPFVQTMISKAAEDSYQGLRRHLKACFAKVMAARETPDRDDQLLVIRPPDEQGPGAVLQIWTDLPDEAVSALSQLLYNLRA
ncbi:MAG TPA: hypothetical protein VK599_17555, partial [Streptosporangiaceae bacterium]|nr:hypothetical protein [Streptosporangiaceae bacterium]